MAISDIPRVIAAPAAPHAALERMPWLRFAIGGSIGVLAGLAFAYALPRGPITTLHVLITMIVSLGIGLLGGLVTRSRWSLLLVPVGFLMAFELGRRGTVSGPSIDTLRLDSLYGVLAFVLGRIALWLAGVLPMMLGALLATRPPRIRTALFAMGLGALAFGMVLPGSTPPISDASGKPLAGSIASLEAVRLGGQEQWITLRGRSVDSPVLLYLAGGPGQSDLPFVRILFHNLEQDFVVVDWDQRGTGKSYPALDPASTHTLDQAIADTIELTEYLRARFDEPKIYLVGESWGSTLGVLAAQRRPDLYYAVIGSGQMVSQRETDRRLYTDVLALTERTGDTELRETMQRYGEPPYSDPFAYAVVMQQYDKLYKPYTPPDSLVELGATAARETGPWGVLGREYNLIEKVSVMRGLTDTFALMYPQLQGIDFRRDVPSLQVPYVMLDGAAELTARRDLALEWYAQLEAPRKHLFTFENSAHSVAQEQFVAFRQILLETILPETYAPESVALDSGG
jgi:proline iminopeptidase